MESIKSSLDSFPLPKKIKENLLRLELIKKVWKEVVKNDSLSPVYIMDDYLFIESTEHYLLQQIRLNSYLICQKINNCLEEACLPPIKGIKTRLAGKPSTKLNEKKVFFQKQKPSSEELQTLLNLCQHLKDDDLKVLFQRLIKTFYA